MAEDMILRLHSLGNTRIPPENPTQQELTVYIKDLLALDTQVNVAVRFEIGTIILEQPWEHGEKFEYCEKNFGQRAKWIMECAAIARAWVWNQNVGWAWSYYKALVKFDKKDKQDFVKLYNQGRIRTVAKLNELIGQFNGKVDDFDTDQDQIPYVGKTGKDDKDTIEAELKPETPALPPPPAHAETPQGLAYQLEIDNAPKVETDHVADFFAPPVVGFKVEGQSVERVTYAPPARWTPEEDEVPPYLRTRAPEGLRDGPRPAVSAAVVVPTDDPCVVYARCEVPVGGLSAGSLFTVAIHRDQLR